MVFNLVAAASKRHTCSAHSFLLSLWSLIQCHRASPASIVQGKRANVSEDRSSRLCSTAVSWKLWGSKLCRTTAPNLSTGCAALLSLVTSCHAHEASVQHLPALYQGRELAGSSALLLHASMLPLTRCERVCSMYDFICKPQTSLRIS